MTIAEAVMREYPLQISTATLRRTLEDIAGQIAVYQGIVESFERQHGCRLEEFEARIDRGEVPEHPSWETAIEWGVASDELQRLQVIKHKQADKFKSGDYND